MVNVILFTERDVDFPQSVSTNIPGKGKGRVVSNERDDINATQFQVRLGKNTTVPVTLGFTKSTLQNLFELRRDSCAALFVSQVVIYTA